MTPKDEAKQQLLANGFSAEQILYAERAGFKCEYCDRDLLASVDDYDAWQLDHIYPVSKEGSDDSLNMAVACKTCNSMKRAACPPNRKPPSTEDERARLIEWGRDLIAEKRTQKQLKVAKIRCLARALLEPGYK